MKKNTPIVPSEYVLVDDYYLVTPTPRYGHGNPPHPQLHALFSEGNTSYEAILNEFAAFMPEFKKIPAHKPDNYDGFSPYWFNGWLPPLDGITIYGHLATLRPKLFMEIGSGHSTRFARKSIEDNNLATRLVSVDPLPRAEIDNLCNVILRQGVESVDLSFFDQLTPDDILFFDGSHRALQNSDVTVFFMEILPRIPAGCLVGLHDIELPQDYSPDVANRWYNEQYLLACMLLYGHEKFEIVFPSWHMSYYAGDKALAALNPLWDSPGNEDLHHHGSIFWFRKK